MKWAVWRQDDNGNRFLVSHHATEAEAAAVARELERRGHKQIYSVEPVEPSAGEAAEGA